MEPRPTSDPTHLARLLRGYLAEQVELYSLTITTDSDLLAHEWIKLMANLTTWGDQVTFGDAVLRDYFVTSFETDQLRRVTTVHVQYTPRLIDREDVLAFVRNTLDDIFAARGLGDKIMLLLGHLVSEWPSKAPKFEITDA